uniref:Reverse transcriptase Ty1/copia-type domain-containing protein n=1 Tax=Lactuca sativa TaxID=4236 RepID=A0A9R1UUL2_LACSA|nr:hypothetical protein LSAT_V11C800440810 [Lactuca sativa]
MVFGCLSVTSVYRTYKFVLHAIYLKGFGCERSKTFTILDVSFPWRKCHRSLAYTGSPCSMSLCPEYVSPLVQLTVTPNAPPPSPKVPSTLTQHPSYSSHLTITRSEDDVFKLHHFVDLFHLSSWPIHQALFTNKEPRGYKSVAKNPKWFDSMTEEMATLHQNATWELVPNPKNTHLVTQGFTQYWVYANDIIIVGNHASTRCTFIFQLNKEFSFTNLGRL